MPLTEKQKKEILKMFGFALKIEGNSPCKQLLVKATISMPGDPSLEDRLFRLYMMMESNSDIPDIKALEDELVHYRRFFNLCGHAPTSESPQ
jgi:hypothetical protein